MYCCSQCQAIESVFDEKTARKDLTDYRKKGPDKPTRALIEALTSRDVEGLTLLDVGGGVGAVHHELLHAGLTSATDVDASNSYLAAAQSEAERQGHAGRVTYHHGDFVDLATDIDEADVVTLNRVICCYDDVEALVGLSSARARRLYGAVYPQDSLLVRLSVAVGNFILKLTSNPFRMFVHPTQAVDAMLRRQGLEQRFHQKSGFAGLVWQVVVYERVAAA